MTSALQGGATKRHRGPKLALLGLLLACVAGAAAGWFLLVHSSAGQGSAAAPIATRSPLPTAREAQASAAPAPPASAPLAVDLEAPDTLGIRPKDPPRAGLMFDLQTGEVLWRHRPQQQLPIASLTKIMTAIVVVERTKPDEHVKITRAALGYRGSGVGVLPRGEQVPLEALLHGMLLVSGNDASIALADHVAGSERGLVRIMNRRAQILRLRCTRFVSVHGFEKGNRSCAADLAVLTRMAMGNPRIAGVVAKLHAAPRFPIANGRLFLTSTNPLLRMRYRGTIGLKTGYTTEAGRCYAAVVQRGGRRLGLLLLDSADPSTQARNLFDRAFAARRKRPDRRPLSASRIP